MVMRTDRNNRESHFLLVSPKLALRLSYLIGMLVPRWVPSRTSTPVAVLASRLLASSVLFVEFASGVVSNSAEMLQALCLRFNISHCRESETIKRTADNARCELKNAA